MATLTLTVLRCPDHGASEQRQVKGGQLTVGRDADCDWRLPDPAKSLSRRHCTLEYVAGAWQVRDLSSNGTFVNGAAAPIGRDRVQSLRDGDRLMLGDYEIEVRVETATQPMSARFGLDDASSPFADTPRQGFGGARLPGLDDPVGGPVALSPPPPAWNAMPDHSPSGSDAFVPPPTAPAPAGQQLVPDDWLSDVALGPAAPAVSPPRAATPPSPAAWAPSPALPEPFGAPPAAEFGQTVRAPAPSRPAASPVGTDLEFDPIPVAPPPRVTPVARVGGGDMTDALAALLAGGELPPEMALRAAEDPQAALRNAGALLRAAVAGVRALLIARGSVKREFRIEQTMLRTRENNPLKFAASDEQALAALLDPRTSALSALGESIHDLTMHQVAVLAATQAAARALLERLDPGVLEAEDKGGGGLFSDSLEKRLWEAYKRRHSKLLEQFEDDFESAFGKAFARAYEQAVARAKG